MNTGPAKDIPALTGVRGVAAFAVFMTHSEFYRVLPGMAGVQRYFFWHGEAVDLFFLLSGFILCHVYGTRPPGGWWSFFTARVARIYPLHLLTLFFCVAGIWMGFYKEAWNTGLFWKQFFLVNLWPGFFTIFKWNPPQWSISVEWFCYIFLFPLAALAARILKGPRLLLAVALVLLVAANIVQIAIWKSHYLDLTRGLLGFLAGIVLFHFSLAWAGARPVAARFADRIGILLLALILLGGMQIVSFGWMLLLFPALILALLSGDSWTARLLTTPFFLWLGNISYALYLVHWPLFKTLQDTGVRDWAATLPTALRIAYICAVLFGTLGLCSIIYLFFEKPSRTLIRRSSKALAGRFHGKFGLAGSPPASPGGDRRNP